MRRERKLPSENGPKGKTNRKNIMINPNRSIDIYVAASSSGRNIEKTFDPSSGGMGIRLINPSIRL